MILKIILPHVFFMYLQELGVPTYLIFFFITTTLPLEPGENSWPYFTEKETSTSVYVVASCSASQRDKRSVLS